ncbi:MAG: hypothetical protein DRG31_03310 [Deltaproteobacteria bacterium]|nr:MAG: hypothetical protein DRG31_03310 [Deltaproteobacteria bacterium]
MNGREFERGLKECQGALYGFLVRLMGNPEEAKEAMQTAVLKAWEARDGLKERSRFRAWLFRIAANVAADMMRRKERFTEMGDLPTTDADPLILEEERSRLQRAIGELPERQRMALLLKVYGELKYSEIARAMDLTEGAVKAHIHHALRKLKEALREDEV